MKKFAIVSVLVLGGFFAQAQATPKAKPAVKKEGSASAKAECKKGKSCCKNESSLSAIKRPMTKQPAAKKS